MTNPLRTLQEYGQSVWLDFVSRELLQTGRLARLIAEDGLTGVTSNPSIFEKAIGHGDDYDALIARAQQRRRSRSGRLVRGARGARHPGGCRRAAPGLRSDPAAATALSASKSRPIWRCRRTRRSRRRAGCGTRSAATT